MSYLDGYGTYETIYGAHETIAAYKPIDFLLNYSSGYKLLKDGQEIFLRNRRGRALSDRSSRWWDAVKAVESESGFEVLLEGTRGRRRAVPGGSTMILVSLLKTQDGRQVNRCWHSVVKIF